MSAGELQWIRTLRKLDQTIWSSVPSELEERLLPWLPIDSIARLRSVCKRWHEVLSSPSLLDNKLYVQAVLHSKPPTPQYFEVFKVDDEGDWIGASHNAMTQKWSALPLDNIKEHNAWVYDTCGPLFCCVSERGVENHRGGPIAAVSICNPFTKFWKDLPSLPHNMRYYSFKIVIDDLATSSFKVITAGWSYTAPRDTQVYSSKTNSWKSITRNTPSLHATGDWLPPCNGAIYTKVFTMSSDILTLNAFILTDEIWIEIKTRLPQFLQPGVQLVVCEPGRLLLVGGIGTSKRPHSLESMKIWELHKNSHFEGIWEEVAEVPTRLFEDFLHRPSSFVGFKFVGVGQLIYILSTCHSRILTYKLASDSWQRMKENCIFDLNKAIGRGFSFSPSLLGFDSSSRTKTPDSLSSGGWTQVE